MDCYGKEFNARNSDKNKIWNEALGTHTWLSPRESVCDFASNFWVVTHNP